MNSLVTILLPTYNGEKFIKQMLDSILGQDYRPIQVVISDDCSADNTYEMCKEWKEKLLLSVEKEFTVKLVKKKKNVGLSKNISSIISYAEGDYICLADQDDVWKKDKIRKQVEYLEKNLDCIMCICDRTIIDEKNRILLKSEAKYKRFTFTKYDFKKVLIHPSIYAANVIMLRNSGLDKIFPIPSRIKEHDNFIVTLGTTMGSIGFVNESLIDYRIHHNNLSQLFSAERSKNIFQCYKSYLQQIKRAKDISIIDSKIIKACLKKRMNINIEEHHNKLASYRINNPFISAIQLTTKDFSDGKINSFYKNK